MAPNEKEKITAEKLAEDLDLEEVESIPEIAAALKLLNVKTEALESAIYTLIHRLDPIMRPETPESQRDELKEKPAVASPLRLEIEEVSRIIDGFRKDIMNTLNRLEI